MKLRYWIKSLGMSGLLMLVCSLSLQAFTNHEPRIKVLLNNQSNSIALNPVSQFNFFGIELENDHQKITLAQDPQGSIKINDRWLVQSPFYTTDNAGVLLNGRTYMGVLEVHNNGNTLKIINNLPLEQYLKGVVCFESDPNWSIEALKAQAVLSRSYALAKLRERQAQSWHIRSWVQDQVYKGRKNLPARCNQAIEETYGLAVWFQDQVVSTFYHANSGGVTARSKDVWNVDLAYTQTSSIPYGTSDPEYFWQIVLTPKELTQALRSAGQSIGKVYSIWVEQYSESERARVIGIQGQKKIYITGENLRALVGFRRLKSTKFTIEPVVTGFAIKGQGNGHGVGYCQWCGKEMAEQGFQFDGIIKKFFHQVEIVRIY